MQKVMSLFALTALPSFVAAQEETIHAPSETVGLVYVGIFGIVFVGMIVGFFVYLYISEKKNKPGQE